MSSECDLCGLEDPDCHCELYELRKRVDTLEEVLGKLSFVVFQLEDSLETLHSTLDKPASPIILPRKRNK